MTGLFRFRTTEQVFELNGEQRETLGCILNTFVPDLPQEAVERLVVELAASHSAEEVRTFCQVSSKSMAAVEKAIGAVQRTFLPNEHAAFLSLLESLAGFRRLDQAGQERVVLGWKYSQDPIERNLYNAFHSLAASAVYTDFPYPFSAMMRLPPPQTLTDLPPKLPMLTHDQVNARYDAIVIGSGAGGGVVAARLAQAGQSVLVIEKGKYHHESDFVPKEQTGNLNLYEFGGTAQSRTGGLRLMVGSVLGGGTTVNWSASLKPQHFVRQEWAQQGLPYFLSSKFAQDLDTVCQRIGATTEGVVHNGSNQIVIDGCNALGYPVATIPQNTGGKSHDCSYCYCGCRSGTKNGTMNTWLRDAHAHGAHFLDQTKVLKVLTQNGKAIGVECQTEQTVQRIMADTVVVSAGSLQSPGVLLRSGLKNKNIGKNLRLHPAAALFGFFDRPIHTGQGTRMTTLSTVVEDYENDGYGCKIEGVSLHPGSLSALLPWTNAAAHKSSMLRYDYCAPLITLTRDKDSIGSVTYDADQNIVVDYALSEKDERSIAQGILSGLDILVAAGARELSSGQYGIDPFCFKHHPRIDDPDYLQWKARVKAYGFSGNEVPLLTAHQMSSNRMGISPEVSVVKPTGETWEIKHLYVADASIFPTASGVNPMVTTETMAYHVADNIIQSIKSKL
ncbi:GMC oxidoreductase-domain-containing protein [Sporodiniella umbellata]|nr:GMC oxidoreductase-domain-containing protein [Sporodiniella umbellata]